MDASPRRLIRRLPGVPPAHDGGPVKSGPSRTSVRDVPNRRWCVAFAVSMSATSTTEPLPHGFTTNVGTVHRTRIGHEVEALRASFDPGLTRPLEARLEQLDALARGIRVERPRLAAALKEELGKSRVGSAVTEIGVRLQEIAHMKRNLRSWLRPESFALGMMLAPVSGAMHRESYGVALIICPWNYPVNLALSPLIGAIASGNTTLIKPNETPWPPPPPSPTWWPPTSTRSGCVWSKARSPRPRPSSSSAST